MMIQTSAKNETFDFRILQKKSVLQMALLGGDIGGRGREGGRGGGGGGGAGGRRRVLK
jgi:hypothetical protein